MKSRNRPFDKKQVALKMIAVLRTAVFVIFLMSASAAQAVVKVSGRLSEDTIWTKEGGPYLIQADLVVEKQASLVLEPGTIVYVLPSKGGKKTAHSTANTDLIIKGVFEAKGTAAEPIYFSPAKKGSSWGAICFEGGGDRSSMEYCWIAYGGIYCDGASPFLISCGLTKCQFGLMLHGASKPRVSKTRFVGNRSGIYMSHKKAELSMANCELRGNGYGIVLRDFKLLEATTSRIHKNQMSVVNMTQKDVDIPGNWWGSKDEFTIAKGIHDADDDPKLGRINYFPLFGQSEVEAEAIGLLREDAAEQKMDIAIGDWDYAVPGSGKMLFTDAGAVGNKRWRIGAVLLSAGGAAALLLLL
jgi:hypothetical protein